MRETIDAFGVAIDVVGVVIIVAGLAVASWRYVGGLMAVHEDPYRRFRQDIGRAILLGLEVLVAADIIRTVAVKPTLNSVAVLAFIVAIRTFLSFALQLEIDGRFPWQPPRRDPERQ